MTSDAALKTLDDLIRRRSILQHPFYLAWQRGELTRSQLATYARAYFPHVAAFPDYLRNAIACTSDQPTKVALQDNLKDELTNPAPHPELWLDFAEAVGVNRTTVSATAHSGAACNIVSTFRRLTSRDGVSGLTALYSYESQQPAVASEKKRGLHRFYGMTGDQAVAYFTVHATADVAHCAAERAGLARCLSAGATVDDILVPAQASLDVYWSLLDGIMKEG